MTRTYKIPSEPSHGGWAKFIIDDDGYFSVVSDYGNYAFHWTAFGDNFREFLLDISPDYLMGKLSNGKMSFDLEASQARLYEVIKELQADIGPDDDDNVDAEDLASAIKACYGEEDLKEILKDQDILEEWWEYLRQDYPADLKGFATRVYPRFVAMLKVELNYWWR